MKKTRPSKALGRTEHATAETRRNEQALLAAVGIAGPDDRNRLLTKLFEQHYERVVKWCLHLVGNEADALDLAQEVFVKAQLSLEGFRQDCSVSTWLHVITRRAFLDRIRSLERKPTDALSDELALTLEDESVADFIDTIDAKLRTSELRTVIAEVLNANEQRALYLRFVEDLSIPEITRRMELDNRSGAKALIVSSFRKLRAYYAGKQGHRALA